MVSVVPTAFEHVSELEEIIEVNSQDLFLKETVCSRRLWTRVGKGVG